MVMNVFIDTSEVISLGLYLINVMNLFSSPTPSILNMGI